MRLTRAFLTVLVFATAALFVAGCRTAPVYNVTDAPVSTMDDSPVTMDQVHDAIVRAGTSLGWRMKEVEPGHMVGTLHVRTHMAQVDINYTTEGYDITYKNSSNLKYDGTNIHSNYNGWIQNLDNAIQSELMTL
ncbi:MAG: hypothetical protein PVH31_05150 [Ectothiorhodospiraceae bacterium]|jgi:hypothetical protein